MIEASRVMEIARAIAPEGGIFVEAGANDGIRQSNTLLLERELGWTGLLVEPSPSAFALLELNRPNCVLVNSALVSSGDSRKVVSGAFLDGHLTGTLDPALLDRVADVPTSKFQSLWVRIRRALGLKAKTTMVSVSTTSLTNALLDSPFNRVDLFSLDVEGFELQALSGLDFSRIKPKVIIIEVRKNDMWQIVHLLVDAGYLLIENLSNFEKTASATWTQDHEDFLFVAVEEFLSNSRLREIFQTTL